MPAMIAQDMLSPPFEARLQFLDGGAPFRPIAGEKFRRGAWSRRTHISHEISNGEIGLMPDGGKGGHAARGQRPRDNFFIKGPEVFEAASASRHHEKIDLFFRAESVNGLRDFL